MKQRLYVAYGSNLNFEQMVRRCPTAKLVGTGVIENCELQFKGYQTNAYATIAPKMGGKVPVAVWDIQPQDEKRLDVYEGYPRHYYKKGVRVQMKNGDKLNAMVYIMNQKMQFGMPSAQYFCTVYQGYQDCGLDTHVLSDAVQKSAMRYYQDLADTYAQQMKLRVPETESEEEEELDEEDYEDEKEQEYTEGMQL